MRVLLVEDDPSTERFVALALEDLPVQLDCCDSVARAREQLAAGSYALVLSDLMLKGESALVLVQQLSQEPALLRGARIAVYSAGLTQERRAQLAQWGVWRMLDKPVPLAVLRDCVMQALELPPASAAQPPGRVALAEASAIATHFAGNRALFLAFRTSCQGQFPRDAAAVRQALAAHDAGGLHRLGHSLKSVLLTLGEPSASQLARDAEVAARDGDWQAVERHWPALADWLDRYGAGG